MPNSAAGLALHRAGRLDEAEAAYRACLLADAGDVEALHGLGVLLYGRGDAGALALLERAGQAAPARPDIAFNHGLALLRAGRLAEAAARFQAAIRGKPDWPEAHYNLGNVWRDLGEVAAAAREFRQALRLRPGYVQAEVNLGTLLRQQGKLDPALACYRRVLARHPDLPETRNNLGTVLLDLGDRPGAEAAFRQAISGKPDFAEALGNLGTLLAAEGGMARRREAAGLLARAASLLRARLAAGDVSLETHALLAENLLGLRDFAAAAAVLGQAVAAFPGAARPAVLLAEVLRNWGRFEAAEAALDAVPPHAGDLLTRGMLYRDLGRLEESEAAFRAALKAAPKQAMARYGLAQTLLAAGRFAEGFAAFEARIDITRPAAQAGRRWDGSAPRGKRILVVAEEGLGDSIQFARFVPRLTALGARVVFMVPPSLKRLFSRLPGGASLVDAGTPPPPFDAWCLLMSLPRLLGVGDVSVLGVPYLSADPDLVSAWRDWLPEDGMRIGLCWAGQPLYAADHLRSCPPEKLAPLMRLPGVHWVSLQPGAAADAVPGGTLIVPGARMADMADTAALISALDLVITVDTAVAHLAGALGKPVWLLNRFNACWRWSVSTASSVWYSSLVQVRQQTSGGGAGVGDWVVHNVWGGVCHPPQTPRHH
jgi:tetratricopeptide (TPR) repeat protein